MCFGAVMKKSVRENRLASSDSSAIRRDISTNEAVVSQVITTAFPRNDAWLQEFVDRVRTTYFADVPHAYPIVAKFGRRAHRRFGSIGARNRQSVLRVNGLLADPQVPLYVVEAVVAHELAHYAHGFGSGLDRRYKAPHRGGVVDAELEQRGLGTTLRAAKMWIEQEWEAFYLQRCVDLVKQAQQRQQGAAERWLRFFAAENRRTLAEIEALIFQIAAKVGFWGPIPKLEWLHATRKQCAPSYWHPNKQVLQLHGLLADRRVPNYYIEFELAYWLVRWSMGSSWERIQPKLWEAGLRLATQRALDWRPKWRLFLKQHHPLA